MAIVTRYFSTTGAGSADGTSWANRAAFLSAGTPSTVITNFAFNGSDSLEIRIGPGTYTLTTGLATASFTNPPTAANPILLHGCDSSGNLLTPPDPNWTSDMPAWDDSGLPVLATTTNIQTLAPSNTNSWHARLLKFTASGRNGNINNNVAETDWCVVTNTTANTAAIAQGSSLRITNSVLSCTGSSYAQVLTINSSAVDNCRIVGVAGSSGNRDGIVSTATTTLWSIQRTTIIAVGGRGVVNTGASTGVTGHVGSCTIVNCGGTGIELPSTASQTSYTSLTRNYISGCGAGGTGYGINAQSAAHVIATDNRLRDNATGDLNGFGNLPTTWGNYTTDSDDATEFVDSASGDYRIKSGAAIYGSGYGVSEQVVSGGGGLMKVGGMTGGMQRS